MNQQQKNNWRYMTHYTEINLVTLLLYTWLWMFLLLNICGVCCVPDYGISVVSFIYV